MQAEGPRDPCPDPHPTVPNNDENDEGKVQEAKWDKEAKLGWKNSTFRNTYLWCIFFGRFRAEPFGRGGGDLMSILVKTTSNPEKVKVKLGATSWWEEQLRWLALALTCTLALLDVNVRNLWCIYGTRGRVIYCKGETVVTNFSWRLRFLQLRGLEDVALRMFLQCSANSQSWAPFLENPWIQAWRHKLIFQRLNHGLSCLRQFRRKGPWGNSRLESLTSGIS